MKAPVWSFCYAQVPKWYVRLFAFLFYRQNEVSHSHGRVYKKSSVMLFNRNPICTNPMSITILISHFCY